jgi:hypothetical protein
MKTAAINAIVSANRSPRCNRVIGLFREKKALKLGHLR